MKTDVQSYIHLHESDILADLTNLVAIPSVSCQPSHRADMLRCAELWQQLLLKAGADHAEVMPTEGNPVVFAEKIVDAAAPSVLVYAHYDVMPAEPLDVWLTSPFALTRIDDVLWGRGADDNKGQSFIQLQAFAYLVAERLLTHNVKFLIEGEEEIGSPSLRHFLEDHSQLLQCSVVLISDTCMLGRNLPSLTSGLRGLQYWEVEVTGPDKDLHSGLYGGAVANPINVLCRMLADVVDADGHITLPHFYDDVLPIADAEREQMRCIPFNESEYMSSIGVKALAGEAGYSTLERNSCRPSFDVCGIWGGETTEGSKTVLPSKAFAKVSCRLVPNQDYRRICKLFADYLQSVAPDSVSVKVTPRQGGAPYFCPPSHPAWQAAVAGFSDAFGKEPISIRRGESIGILSDFEEVLGAKTILMGFGLESNAIHSPNENMPLDIFRRGIHAVVSFHLHYDTQYSAQI